MKIHFMTSYGVCFPLYTGLDSDTEYWFDVDKVSIKGNELKFLPRSYKLSGCLETRNDFECNLITLEDVLPEIRVKFEDLEFLNIDGVQFITALPD